MFITFVPIEPAKPLHNAQIGRSFYFISMYGKTVQQTFLDGTKTVLTSRSGLPAKLKKSAFKLLFMSCLTMVFQFALANVKSSMPSFENFTFGGYFISLY